MNFALWARRSVGMLIAALATGFVVPVVTAAPAMALTNVGTISGVEFRCNNSPYFLCLYYNSSMGTAWWGTSVAVSNLSSPTVQRFFANTGTGSGQAVKNNAAAVSCDASSTSICYVFFNSGFSGPTDWLYGQHSGRLVETYNENASVRISFGA